MTKVVTLTFPPPPADLVAEVLTASLDALTRAEIDVVAIPSRANHLAVTRAMNDLYDVCLQAGMPFDEPNIAQWATAQTCAALVAA